MSSFTTYLSEYMKRFTDTPYPTSGEVIEKGLPYVFSFPYSFYADGEENAAELKHEFERQFAIEYYMNEIGFETFEYFQLRLQSRLAQIMPKYTAIYKQKLLEVRPLITVDMLHKDSYESTDEGNSTTNGENGISRTETGNGTENATNTAESSVKDTINQTVQTNGEETASSENSTKITVDGTLTTTATNDKTYSNSGEDNTDTQGLNSDTPQINYASVDYASNLTRGKTQTDTTASGTERNEDTSTQTTKNNDSNLLTTESTNQKESTDTTKADNLSVKNDETISGKSYENSVNTGEVSNSTQTSNSINKRTYILTKEDKGFSGNKAELLRAFFELPFNLNEQIIKDCRSLFMGIYPSGYEETFKDWRWRKIDRL